MPVNLQYYSRLVLDILFPPRCAGCGEILGIEKRVPWYQGTPEESCFLHRKCSSNFQEITAHYCKICGTPLGTQKPLSATGSHEPKRLCPRCSEGQRAFKEGRSLLVYEGAAREAILQVKYHSKLEYCDYFAFLAKQRLSRWIHEKKIDLIVPVPVHKKKLQSRGYNQAFELARRIGQAFGIPVRDSILIRTKNTVAQKELSPEERSMNLINAFDANGILPPDSTVLLIDDIYTTGATMDACAWVLRLKAKASAVYALSICAAARPADAGSY